MFCTGHSHAGNLESSVHGGYGQMKYSESTSVFGDEISSEAILDTALAGTTVSYALSGVSHFFGSVAADWTLGIADKERWTRNGLDAQVNDLKVFGQFYDVRLGFKKASGLFQYEIYLNGGWDGFRFVRHNFSPDGNAFIGIVAEDFSLWKTGGGLAFGYEPDGWAITGRMGSSYYPDGKVKNSSWDGDIFNTSGVSIDMEAGILRTFSTDLGLYIGGMYKAVRLNESDVLKHGAENVVFPESRAEFLMGVIKLSRSY